MSYEYFLYPFIAIFIAWTWIDYYRLIDIYGKEDLKYFIITFILGASSVSLVLEADKLIFQGAPLRFGYDTLSDIFNCVVRVGLIEELAKAIPFFLVLLIFKNQINEPIDYIAFVCVSALGFAAAENTRYFLNSPSSISARAILSTVGHMMNSAIIGYSLVVMKFKHKKFNPLLLIGSILLAALSHGFYDFWLLSGAGTSAVLITIIYFFYLLSVFATILTNCLNNASNFTYKRVIDSDKVVTRLLIYYGIIIILQLVAVSLDSGVNKAFKYLPGLLYDTGVIILITSMRLSALKLIQGRWNPIKMELPFTMKTPDIGIGPGNGPRIRFQVKGEPYIENYLGNYFEEYFSLCPVSKSSYIVKCRTAYIDRKLFLKDDATFFLAKVFIDDTKTQYEYMLLKAKTKGKTFQNDKYPIVALLKVTDVQHFEDTTKTVKDFKFLEWGYIKPLPPQPAVTILK